MKILLCDSDPAVANLIRFIVTRQQLGEVVVASNGREAMVMLSKLSFDMVITELEPGHFSTLEMITYIRENIGQHIPIILLANADQEDKVLEGFRTGANDYMLKPFSLAELALRIKRFADRGEQT
ncbi:MAG: response regulator transcription factor [Cyclobacteriaceae bacterium]|nr:response regulator transcription factor [Cyclobacteriaceae bacterium]